MKKLFFTLILSLLLLRPSALLATDEETLPDPGLTPDSPFYFLDQVGEYIDLLLTFNEDKKIEKELLFAEERLAELNELSETADESTIEKLTEAYNEKVANAIFLANEGEEKENRLQVIEQARERHVLKLQFVISKAPEQALPALGKVLEKAQVKLDDIQNQIEGNTEENGEENGELDRKELKEKVKDAVENTKNNVEDETSENETSDSNSSGNGSSGSSNGNSGNGNR